MTEEEMRTKVCCGPAHCGSRGTVDIRIFCIGSACAAWRWGITRSMPASITEIAAHMKAHEVGPLDAAGATSHEVKTGFCGLAGAPS